MGARDRAQLESRIDGPAVATGVVARYSDETSGDDVAERRREWSRVKQRWVRNLAICIVFSLFLDAYKACLARAKRALASGSFPTTILGLIDDDIKTTLPSLHLFIPETGPMYEDLKDILCAWVVARSDEGQGYVIGASKIAAMLLLNMPAMQAFLVMRNMLERHCMRSFYGGYAAADDVSPSLWCTNRWY